MKNSKIIYVLLYIFGKQRYFNKKKKNLIPTIFSIILISNNSEIYVDNPHFYFLKSYKNQMIYGIYNVSDKIRFEIISDTQNMSIITINHMNISSRVHLRVLHPQYASLSLKIHF